MAIAITTEQIQAAVATHLAANLTSGVTVQYAGQLIDTESLAEWAEVWVRTFRRPPQRIANKDQRRGEILVRLFCKKSTDHYRVLEISKDFTSQLMHAQLTLIDYDDSSGASVGYLQINEPRRRDVTRRFNEALRSDVRAMELIFPAYAQED